MLGEFQGFTRDLHDLTAERLLAAAAPTPAFVPILTEAMTRGRGIDTGNATVKTIGLDFQRLGMKVDWATYDAQWGGHNSDSNKVGNLFKLRNALAHGNEKQLQALRNSGTRDTVTWGRSHLPVLNRMARALDHMVWDHLKAVTGRSPWEVGS